MTSVKASIVITDGIEIIDSPAAACLNFDIGTHVELCHWKVYQISNFLLLADLSVCHVHEIASAAGVTVILLASLESF